MHHITTENMIREWDRNKQSKASIISSEIRAFANNSITAFKGTLDIVSAYNPDLIEPTVEKRINKVDLLLKVHSEIAKENEIIYLEAARRNLECLAPNHSKDSFRDTVNVLTLISHLKEKKYESCIFSTINYKDFSDGNKKHDLHTQLAPSFKEANLQYIYCDEKPFAEKLISVLRNSGLPNFEQYYNSIQIAEENKRLNDKKAQNTLPIDFPDTDYIENIQHIDMILNRKNPTAVELQLLSMLTNRHESYKQYFLRNVGKNDLV